MKKALHLSALTVLAAAFCIGVSASPAIIDETHGILLAGTDFEEYAKGSCGVNIGDAVYHADYMNGASVFAAASYGTYSVTDDPTGGGHGNVLAVKTSADAVQRAYITFDGLTLDEGTLYLSADVYSAETYAYRIDCLTDGDMVYVSRGIWQTVERTVHVGKDGASLTGVNLPYALNSVTGTVYYDNLTVRYRPKNAVTFARDDYASMRCVTADTYTIPVSVGGVSEDTYVWHSGKKSFLASDTVPSRTVEGRTLRAVTAKETLDGDIPLTLPRCSIRIAGEDHTSGLRFAGFVSTDVREDAAEYGFIVARADAFYDVGGDYASYLVFPDGCDTSAGVGTLSIGKPFVCGVSYRPTSSIDRVYAESGDVFGIRYEDSIGDGGVYFTGVAMNFDITSASQVKTALAVRPYVKVGDTYTYGEPYVRSLYQMAAQYKTVCEQSGREIPAYITDILSSGETPVYATLGEAYTLIDAPNGVGLGGSAASGWDYDNRFEWNNTSGTTKNYIFDDNGETFTALSRDIAPQSDGVLTLEAHLSVASEDGGAYIAFENENGDRLFGLTECGGKWALFGKTTCVSDIPLGGAAKTYAVGMTIRLDDGTVSATVDHETVGQVAIRRGDTVSRLVLGTNAAGTGSVTMHHVRLVNNYAVYDSFLTDDETRMPFKYDVIGDVRMRSMASQTGTDTFGMCAFASAGDTAYAFRSFDALGGNVAVETCILLPLVTDGASFIITSGDNDAVTLTTRGDTWYANGERLANYIPNVWQTLRVEADTANGRAVIKLNGKTAGSVSFDAAYFDGVTYRLAPDADREMWFDDLHIWNITETADYPSAPVTAAHSYNIGINTCFLWRDQNSNQGFDLISAFPEKTPLLGYFDEGSPEASDWQLKWLAEHGITFMNVCWYAPFMSTTAPIKQSANSHAALHDGYMNAKYSDSVKFSILWENAFGGAANAEQFKNYIFPYWKAYYFSDPRYMTLDGKALLTVYQRAAFIEAFGGESGAKEIVDYMENELKGMGYDGLVLLFGSGTTSTASELRSLVNIGGDGTFAYSWGTDAYSPANQKLYNRMWSDNASASGTTFVPCASTGYNPLGLGGGRNPLITSDGFAEVLSDARSMIDARATGTWRDRTLILGCWNEFSEGTVLFPLESGGFGYLDALRGIFVGTSHTDTLPTSTQKARVNRIYPQRHSLLRRQMTKDPSGIPDDLVPVAAYDMSTSAGVGAWEKYYGGDGHFTSYSESTANGYITGTSPYDEYSIGTTSSRFTPLIAANTQYMHIRMKSTAAGSGQVYFATSADRTLDEAKKVNYVVGKVNEYVDYYINMSENPNWTGTVTQVRIDPVAAPATFWITNIDFLYLPPRGAVPTVTVNRTPLDFTFPPYFLDGGEDIGVCAEPVKGFFSMLRVFHQWDKTDGTLTIKTRDDRTLVFTVGSDTVMSDGTPVSLGYTFALYDGLPVLRMRNLCELLGYDCTLDANGIEIYACTDAERAILDRSAAYTWEFDSASEIGNWVSRQCNVSFGNGCMNVDTTDTDPGISHTVSMKASDYKTIVIGLKYMPDMTGMSGTLYFSSDTTGGMGEANSFTVRYADLYAGRSYGSTVEWVIDTSSNPNFTGNITGLRFDMCSAAGKTIGIDYIRCVRSEKEADMNTRYLFE